jgi:hypothetical protein
MSGEADSGQRNGQGFVFGELLIAVLLLVVAVSSMAALMYSVSHRDDAREANSCVATNSARSAKCVAPAPIGGGPRLLRSDCDRESSGSRRCTDSASDKGESDAVIVRSRTDSAALAIAAKKQRAAREVARTDRGFVR